MIDPPSFMTPRHGVNHLRRAGFSSNIMAASRGKAELDHRPFPFRGQPVTLEVEKNPMGDMRVEKKRPSAKRQSTKRPSATAAITATVVSQTADDDIHVTALALAPARLGAEMEAYFRKCEEKLGFIPNVLRAYAFDDAKLSIFAAMYNDLMLAPSGLTKLEREMIAVVVSSYNRCYYCLVAHGAAVRTLSRDPVLGELMAMNWRAARLAPRERAMLAFADRLTREPWAVEDDDRAALRDHGFSDRDIWDIAAVVGFFNMSNRVASATDMRPNPAYHGQGR